MEVAQAEEVEIELLRVVLLEVAELAAERDRSWVFVLVQAVITKGREGHHCWREGWVHP